MLQVPSDLVDGLIAACKKPAFDEAQKSVAHVFAEGYSINAVLEELLTKLMHLDDLDDVRKARVVAVMATADKRLVDGADGMLQMQHVLSVLQQVYQGA
jgi:DNA polymerase III delta prime subunit